MLANNNKTILIVDDTVANLDILADILEEYDVIDTINGAEALEIVEQEKINLILLDIMMPQMDGFEVCRRLKSNEKTKDIPVIFITAKTDEDTIDKAYDIGGADYITKPFRPRELLQRIKTQLKLQDTMKELKLLASTDPLTKLYNRRYFTKLSSHIFDLSKRQQQPLSMIMLDIDKFKNVNDTYGHQIGDEVIKAVSLTLLENQRKSDISCRYGGEEFVVLLPNTSSNGAKNIADKIRKIIENLSVINMNNKSLNFTVSFGVSQVDLDSEPNIEAALKRADDALYDAKNSGRNRVCIK